MLMKSGFYTTAGDDQHSDWTEKLQSTSQSQTWTKKKGYGLFGGLLPVWSTTVFWILTKPLHLRSILTKSMSCTKNCNTSASIGQQKGPNSSPQTWPHVRPLLQKLEQIGLRSFALSTIFKWLFTNRLPLLQASQQLFAGKMLPQPVGCRKCFPRVRWILKHDFYATGINKLISYWQKCADCNGSYFD